ncbi:PglL family O-oligosaccharyltransferase [Pseudomonas sp. GV071]|uniref:PglL family O-oligosaccharyltransferase n=1 Tax=Pseudomonas sp. GV071 TaxID=2135754 RepID=UPI000D430545|nr:O-antigen ligase family protein [Pseudomonas sp. GV071]PTQ67708.1 O-antigen ligase [Pseudomonas sp. GV071]
MSFPTVSLRPFALLLFVVVLAFCQPVHAFPLPNFIEELIVVCGTLFGAGLLFWRSRQLRLTVWLLMWLILGALFVVSGWLHPAPFVSAKLFIGVFWFMGLLALVIGDQLDWDAEGERLSDVLAVALLAGALICAIGGFLHFYGLLGDFGRAYLPVVTGGRWRGLVGHSNFFAFICFLGMLAVGWVYAVRHLIGLPLAIFCLLVLATSLIGSGSRAVLVAWVFVIGVLFFLRRKEGVSPWLWVMLGSFFFYWAFRPIFFTLDDWAQTGVASAGSADVLSRGAVSSPRLEEWRVALDIILQNFWGGVGVGNYPGNSFQHRLDLALTSSNLLFVHSHNLILQLLAELGVAALIWLLALVGVAVTALKKTLSSRSRLLPVLVLASIQIYGMFEFPLWMMHFLVLHMLLLGALGGPAMVVKLKVGKVFSGIIFAAFLAVMIIYLPLTERLVWSYKQYFLRAPTDSRSYTFVDSMIRDPLLEPYGYLVYFANFDIAPASLGRERDVLLRFKNYMPYPAVLVRLSLVYMAGGDELKAQAVLLEMRRFYGDSHEGKLAEQIAATQKFFPDIPFERLKLPVAAKPAE